MDPAVTNGRDHTGWLVGKLKALRANNRQARVNRVVAWHLGCLLHAPRD